MAKSGFVIRYFDESRCRNRFYRLRDEGVFATREAAETRVEALKADDVSRFGHAQRYDVIDLAAGPKHRKPTSEVVTIHGRDYLRLECGHLANDGVPRKRKLCHHC
jgi:hypothetical protein